MMFVKLLVLFFALTAGYIYYSATNFFKFALPEIDENVWWGPGENQPENRGIREFQVKIQQNVRYSSSAHPIKRISEYLEEYFYSQSFYRSFSYCFEYYPGGKWDIDDLKWRLDHVRPLAPPLEGLHHQLGLNTNVLKEVVNFWRTKYNWTKREEHLNQYPQYKTKIQGLDIHFIHIKPKNPSKKAVLPLLMLHGFPSSVWEMRQAIRHFDQLQKNESFVMEIVAPHVPGYGFSQAASKPGLGSPEIATIFKNLMQRLGFEKFYLQGGDIGSFIGQTMTILYPNCVLGFHTYFPLVYTIKSYIKPILYTFWPSWIVRSDHEDRVYPILEKAKFLFEESGYFHIQVTKPDTIGVAMTDSPVGLAAYILEKFITGANFTWRYSAEGNLSDAFSYNDLLDNIMIYWWTGSATTAFRFYSEAFRVETFAILMNPVTVPTAIARFRYDLYTPDGVLDEVYHNIIQLTDHEGGHFAAWHKPAEFAADVIKALKEFEKVRCRSDEA